jgi:pyruvate,water dikinase
MSRTIMLGLLKQSWSKIIAPDRLLRRRYQTFKELLEEDRCAHRVLAELELIKQQGSAVDSARLRVLLHRLSDHIGAMLDHLDILAPARFTVLHEYHKKFDFYARFALAPPSPITDVVLVAPLSESYLPESLIGGKSMHLQRLIHEHNLPVPAGFVLTTRGWQAIAAANGLPTLIDEQLARLDNSSDRLLHEVSEIITTHILSASLPEEINRLLHSYAEKLSRGRTVVRFAVRSSAVGEDSELSFAGQYRSILQVEAADLGRACLRVLASKYEPAPLQYRIFNGLDDQATPMAVLVLEMVEATVSGVMTIPSEADGDFHLYWVDGLGEAMMSGHGHGAQMRVSRVPSSVSPDRPENNSSPLPQAVVHQLVEYGGKIGADAHTSCDVEWCATAEDAVFIVQSRPAQTPVSAPASGAATVSLPLLFKAGQTASAGIGSGTVCFYNTDMQIPPDGAVFVCTVTAPELVSLLPVMNAVIARQGSVADHFSSVAREFSIPVIVQAGDRVDQLDEGQPITVDASRREVYRGLLSTTEHTAPRKMIRETSPVSEALALALQFCTPLSLTDPTGAEFRPSGCRSLHDIMRFAHEQAIYAMFSYHPDSPFRKTASLALASALPLNIRVIALDTRVCGKTNNNDQVSPEDIRSPAFQNFWRGLTDEAINWHNHSHYDWHSYDSVAMAGGIAAKDDAALTSYMLLGHDYLNFNLRFGYHFSLLDSVCGGDPQKNYILLRFAGGGGDASGKLLRLQFIHAVLDRLQFHCTQLGDTLDARISRFNSDDTGRLLQQMGILLAATRLLDMRLHDEERIDSLVADFFAGTYDFST